MRIVTNDKGPTKLSHNNPDKLGHVASAVIKSLRPANRSVHHAAGPDWPGLFSKKLRQPVRELLEELRLHDGAEPLLQERLESRQQKSEMDEHLPAQALAVELSVKRTRIERLPAVATEAAQQHRRALRRLQNWPCLTPRASSTTMTRRRSSLSLSDWPPQ
jgi:hypothetical protein